MARTALTVKQLVNFDGVAGANEFKDTEQAMDDVNGNSIPYTGRELLSFRNTDVSAQTISVISVADKLGRVGDISTYSLAAGETHTLPPLPPSGWVQADGNLYLGASSNLIKVNARRLPDTLLL